MNVLVINAGSSSVKYQLFQIGKKSECVASKGIVDKVKNYGQAIRIILSRLTDKKTGVISSACDIDAIGHRVVHGGEEFNKPVILDGAVIKRIARYNKLAPLHNAPNISCVMACKKFFRRTPQVAVFDTAFHHTIPEHAYIYGIPYSYYKKYGIRRYGFHGTSHSYVAREAARILKKPFDKLRIITCHLGNGCSVTAVCNGKSIDTSMGFTPLEGLIMGTRAGDIDPAIIFFLAEEARLTLGQINTILNKNSGLLGISKSSNDMRDLIPLAKKGNRLAKLAIGAFVYRIVKYIGAYTAVMGKTDAVVFTAGIGENQPYVRDMIKNRIKPFLKNFNTKYLAIKTNEELVIASETYKSVIARKERSD